MKTATLLLWALSLLAVSMSNAFSLHHPQGVNEAPDDDDRTWCYVDDGDKEFMIWGNSKWDPTKLLWGEGLRYWLSTCDLIEEFDFQYIDPELDPKGGHWKASGRTHHHPDKCLEKDWVWEGAGAPEPLKCYKEEALSIW